MITDHDEFWKSRCNTTIKLPSKSYRQIYMEWMHEKLLRKETLLRTSKVYYRHLGCIMSARDLSLRPTDKRQFQFIAGFYQHPNSTQEKTIDLSVDVETSALQLISLLEKVKAFQVHWQQPDILKQMIQRYYRFMQLKATNPPDTLLVPTLDIEMIVFVYFIEQAFLDTCRLCEQRFGVQYCSVPSTKEKLGDQLIYSYWDQSSLEFSSNPPSDYENPFSFTEGDLIVDGKWHGLCKQFLIDSSKKVLNCGFYLYSQDRIRFTEGTMKQFKKSYERFLYMAAKYPPTYAIDIIWHAHMQEPFNYAADCLRLVGYIIYHDP